MTHDIGVYIQRLSIFVFAAGLILLAIGVS